MIAHIRRGFRRGFYRALAHTWRRELEACRSTATPAFIERWEKRIANAERKAQDSAHHKPASP